MKNGPTISPELQTIITASVKNLMDAKQKEMITQVNKTARRQETEDDEKEDDESTFQTQTAEKKKARQRVRKGAENLMVNDSLIRNSANKREGAEADEGEQQESIRRCLPGQEEELVPPPAATTAAAGSAKK